MADQVPLVASLLSTPIPTNTTKSDVNIIDNNGSFTVAENTSIVESSREQSHNSPLDCNPNINEQTRLKIELYMNALVHSLNCSLDTCTFTKCLQFKRVIKHNKSCKKFVNDRCDFCRQLIAISVYHAKNCANHASCLVPFCMTIKQKLEINKSIEFVTNCMSVLRYKLKNSQGVQTTENNHLLPSSQENKRKYMENDDLEVPNEIEISENEPESKNSINEHLKKDFYAKLKEVKEKRLTESERDSTTQLRLNKMSREKVFTTVWQQTASNNPKLKLNDVNYASLMVLLLRRESELNELSDPSGYLYLIAEMFNDFERHLAQYKESSVAEIGVQTETCDMMVQLAPSVSEEMPRKKRLKIE